MAKTIINSSVQPEGRFETICSKCDCHFRFSKSDTYPHTQDDYGGGRDTSNYVDCPQCSHSIMADGIMNPNFRGIFYGSGNIQQKVFRLVDVNVLRATKTDDDFKRALIKMLEC